MSKQGSKTVYKYHLDLMRPVTHTLSGDVVSVAQQGPMLFLWAEARAQPERERTFEVFGTGHVVPSHAVHVGTVMDSPLVWHVYETTAPPSGHEHEAWQIRETENADGTPRFYCAACGETTAQDGKQ